MPLWTVEEVAKPVLKRPVLIEGLPGIGNVGKVAVDFMIENAKAVKLASFFSHTLPHSAFVNEDNLLELPTIEAFYKKSKNGKDVIFLIGDVQPSDEVSCYEFCETILSFAKKWDCSEIVTLGGIGLQSPPKNPKVYITGTNKKAIAQYTSPTIEKNIYGVVGPVIGVSGVLAGLAERKNIPAVTLLAETFGHPLYLGVKGARALVLALEKKLKLGLSVKNLDKEIKELEDETMKKSRDLTQAQEQSKMLRMGSGNKEVNYIG